MKKNLLTLALTAALVLTMAFPAMASENPSTGSTTLTYTVADTYTITIPNEITIAGATATQTVQVNAGSVIPANKTLDFKITAATNYDGTDGFRLKNNVGTDVYLGYTIGYPTDQTISDLTTVFLSASADEAYAGKDVTLTYTPGTAQSAGTYSDTLTFTVGLSA